MRPQTSIGFARTCLLVGTLLAMAPLGHAAALKPDAPQTYTVQPGDTLWSIAGRYLDDPWKWHEIWHGNRVGDPDLIYPGDVLRLTNEGGRPSLRVDRGGDARAARRGGMRVVRLSPRVHTESLKQAIPTIPMASISPFLTQPYVAETDTVRSAPYVVGFPDEHIVAGIGDSVYVRRIDGTADPHYQILRPGSAFVDPDTNETLGYNAVFVANAELERPGDPAKLAIVRAEREVAIGDRALPADAEQPLTNFYPRPAPAGMRGYILAVMNGVTQIGRYDVVVLNKGTADGIEPGQVFEVFRGGGEERDQVRRGSFDADWKNEGFFSRDLWLGPGSESRGFFHDQPDPNAPLPPHAQLRYPRGTYIKPFERAGVLMVFRPFKRVSFGLILEARRPMHIDDQIASPAN